MGAGVRWATALAALGLAILGTVLLHGSASAKPPGKPAFRADLIPALIEGAEGFAGSEGATQTRDIQAVATTLGQAGFIQPGEKLALTYRRGLHGGYTPSSIPVYVLEIRARFPHPCTETLGEATNTCASGDVLELEYVARSLELLRARRWTRYRDLRPLGVPVSLKPQPGMPADLRTNLLSTARQNAHYRGESAPVDIRAVLTTEARFDRLLGRQPGRSAAGEPAYVIAMRGNFEPDCKGGPGLQLNTGPCGTSGPILELAVVPREVPYYTQISDAYPDLAALGTPVLLETIRR